MKLFLLIFSIFNLFNLECSYASVTGGFENKKIESYEAKFSPVKKEGYLAFQERCEDVPWDLLKTVDSESLRQKADYSQFIEKLSKNTAIPSGYQRYIKVDGGWVVSFDAGEFSQSTWFFPESAELGYSLIDKAMDAFYFFNKKTYGFYSYSNLMSAQGKLFSIEFENKKFLIKEISSMQFSPILFSKYLVGDEFFAVTRSKLFSINFDGSFKELKKIDGLGALKPMWLEFINEGYRVGLKSGYLNINLKKNTQEWFLYSACVR